MITVACDRCDKPFQVPDDKAGLKVPCPACGDIKVIPGMAAGPASAAPDRAGALGLPPANGPEATVLRVSSAMFRSRPIAAMAVIVLVLAGAAGGAAFMMVATPQPILAIACGALAVVGVFILLTWKISSLTTRLQVTNKRVVLTRGILSKTTVEMLHRTIQDIEIKQSFADRLLNVGTINIANASEDDDAMVIENVRDPYSVRKTIDAYRPM
jgi:membrane protein YdbS with pleckstrin-like domain